MLSLYEALGVSPDASTADIKAAYHALVLRLHPDKSQQRSRETSTGRSQSQETAECQQVLAKAASQQELAHNGPLHRPQPELQQGGEEQAIAVADGPMQPPAALTASKQECGLKAAPEEADATGVTDVAAGATAAHESADGADERRMRFQQVQAAWQVCDCVLDP